MALIGVGLGSLLSSRAQARAWERDEMRRWRDVRRTAYGDFLAAVRQYRSYVTGPGSRVNVSLHPDGRRLVPGIGQEDSEYQEKMEAAFAAVQMVAQDQDPVDAAHLLTRMARRTAVASAIPGAEAVREDIEQRFFSAEHDFLIAARRSLDLRPTSIAFTRDGLGRVDSRLVEIYQGQLGSGDT
ncbi:hypothetical protein BJY14_007796 [Actinomadura luteofluorescens]|uniref:Uncharacterized protein n=2 Tax=Actinomadura luteofluorescens TaxID=46163 RepID=A0A7Y9EPZ4_9ACTN|nr:hypothetical protein [Actinomadura luteofluorescens]